MTTTRDRAALSCLFDDRATRQRFAQRRFAQARSLRAALTIGLMVWPATTYAYRTAADLSEFDALEQHSTAPLVIGWETTNVTFRLNTTTAGHLNVEEVARAANVAMETWNAPICSALNLTLSGTTTQSAKSGDSINTVQFVDDWSALGFSPNVGAVTDVQYAERAVAEPNGQTRWVIAEADIYLDAENYEWAYEVGNEEDQRKSLLSVLTHELGHAAGLLHPCETENTRDSAGASADPSAPLCGDVTGADDALMYPEYSPTQTLLSADERAGLCFLYAQDSCETLGCPTGELCTDAGCVSACGQDVCAADETCFQDECVPLCSGLDCYVGQECKKTSDCPNFLRCRTAVAVAGSNDAEEDTSEKVCRAGDAPLGDPCDSSRDCASAACSKGGFCVAPCENDEQCTAGTTCEKTQGSVKGCVGKTMHGFGEPCDEANQCLGNQCVSGRAATPVCTRECSLDPDDTNTEACPTGSECGTAVTNGTKRNVCLPLAEAESCSVATPVSLGAPTPTGRQPSARGFSLLGAIGALSLLVHFARRRKPRAHAT